MSNEAPGSIVTCRNRQWINLPSEKGDIIRLKPLNGNEDEILGIFDPLALEKITPASFPPPTHQDLQDHLSGLLLMDAARMSLRSGAGPFRSFGKLSVQPRSFQIVPLLMALKMNTVRLLIADDVGIGKTVEAGLIGRELFDRGEIRRIAVLCPPHLCDQWQRELSEKFNLDAVIVRSGTVAKLERELPNGQHLFDHYQHLIISLDYVKSDRRRAEFISFCPELVIVDEAHTCTQGNSQHSGQQQRYQLVKEVAQDSERHLILLTATPHSGIEASFLSLLGLVKLEFESLDIENLLEQERSHLARHFIQRRRADVSQWLDEKTPFPERQSFECDYQLSKAYRQLFDQVYEFALGLVKGVTQDMSHAQKRGRYWSALALVRCVMSSPAAAVATLSRQLEKKSKEESEIEVPEAFYSAYVDDPTDCEAVVDVSPSAVIEQGQKAYVPQERQALRGFIQLAEALKDNQDSKLKALKTIVTELLEDDHNPIIWCRYIATAEYLAQALRKTFKQSQTRVIAITGMQSDSERDLRLEEVKQYPQRILIATDCLSEGVNLQEEFSAVVHYDLPWNPNRLEQREGRIDRYGQAHLIVKSYLLYGRDNPVDGAVLDVLIRKAVKIHRSLGITVPVPVDSTSISGAVFQSLFESSTQQLSLLDSLEKPETPLGNIHRRWDQVVQRDRISRTRFAQRAIKPTEVQQELKEVEQIFGDGLAVEQFVQTALSRLHAPLQRKKKAWHLANVPPVLQPILGDAPRDFCFEFPAVDGADYIGRHHPLVEGLANLLLEQALTGHPDAIAARCAYVVTTEVQKRTTLLLLRLRHIIEGRKQNQLLAEECFMVGFTGAPSQPQWLSINEANSILSCVTPSGDVAKIIKEKEIQALLNRVDELETGLTTIAQQRAAVLAESHQRVRAVTKQGKVSVTPQLPMDILGIHILQPG